MTSNEKIDIILTPQFYTFLREELGIKFAYQAKQIAPSLFDDYLDIDKAHQFHVYKCDEQWCFFAYDIEEITLFLETKEIKAHQIGKIFFAQELASHLEEASTIGNHIAIQSLNGITTLLPKRLMSEEYEYKELNLTSIPLKNGVTLGSSYDSFIPLKETILISTLLVLLGGFFIAEAQRIKKSVQDATTTKENLLQKNSKLSSPRIRNSILKKYEPINTNERQKRDTLQEISKFLSAQSLLKELLIVDEKISASIEVTNAKTIKQIESRAKAKNFKTHKESNTMIKIEKNL